MKHTMWTVWNGLTSLLVGGMLVLAITLAGVRAVGLQPLAVLSGSMEPKYPVGSLIYVKAVDPENLKAGDIITFRMEGDLLATHRIVEILEEGFRTKGDANEFADGTLVVSRDVVGTPVFSIPALGYLAYALQHPPGKYVALSAGAILLLLILLPELGKLARQS